MIKIKLKETKSATRKHQYYQLLKEVKFADVLKTLGSKADLKKIYQLEMQFLEKYKNNIRKFTSDEINERVKNRVDDLKKFLGFTVPHDIDENQKGIAAIWIKNQALSNFDVYRDVISGSDENSFMHWLERFFKMQRFIHGPFKDTPEGPMDTKRNRDLMTLKDIEAVKDLTNVAEPAYKEFMAQKSHRDAEQGTEVIYEDNQFKIFIPNNKGAACELGKGTEWCTAAPGLDYYEDYHKPDDPLFIIFKMVKSPDNSEIINLQKYQFHYGSNQFMDSQDYPIAKKKGGPELFKTIHKILVKTVGDRFPFLKDSMIETDMGISVRSEEYTHDCEECPGYLKIQYTDIMTETSYGGEHPAKVKIYSEGGSHEFLFEWVAIKSNPPHKPQHPLKAFVSLINGKPVLTTAYWYLRGDGRTYEIATFQDNRGIKLDDGNIYRYLIDQGFEWKNTEELEKNRDEVWQQNGGDFYRLNIQRNPDEYAQSLFDAYIPEHVKKEIAEREERKRADREEITENKKMTIKIKLTENFTKGEFKGWVSRQIQQADVDREVQLAQTATEQKPFKTDNPTTFWYPTNIHLNFEPVVYGKVTVAIMPLEFDNEYIKQAYKDYVKHAKKWNSTKISSFEEWFALNNRKLGGAEGYNDDFGRGEGFVNHYIVPLKYKRVNDAQMAYEEAKRWISPGRVIEISGVDGRERNEEHQVFRRFKVKWISVDGSDLQQFIGYEYGTKIEPNHGIKDNDPAATQASRFQWQPMSYLPTLKKPRGLKECGSESQSIKIKIGRITKTAATTRSS